MTTKWPDIVPISNALVPPFPLEALPSCLREFASELAEAYQVPADLPAMLMFAAAAIPLGGRVTVQAGPEWTEPTNVFVAVALPPSNRKSAVFNEVIAPIYQHEARKEQRLVLDDATPEALPMRLNSNSGRLAIMSPEGGTFDNIAGRYNNGVPNLDVYLKGHAGDRVRVDRVNRPSLTIDSPALTIGLAVQPVVLRSISNKPTFRGRGLLARFLYSIPPSMVGHRKVMTNAIAPQTRENYEEVIRGLLQLDDAPFKLNLADGAISLLNNFRESIEHSLLPGGRLSYIEDWGGKLAGAVVRIAGLTHCAQHATGTIPREISAEVMRDAIVIGEYLINHALAVFDLMGADPMIDNAHHLLDWICSRNISQFSGRDVHQALRGRFRSMASLRPVLDMLLKHGYLVVETPSPAHGRGRPASPMYRVNPQVLTQYSQNTQKSIERDKPVTEGRFSRILRFLSLHRHITAADTPHQRKPENPAES